MDLPETQPRPDTPPSFPAWKFSSKGDDLQAQLNREFNSVALEMWSPQSFTRLLVTLSESARDLEQLREMLQESCETHRKRLLDDIRQLGVQLSRAPFSVSIELFLAVHDTIRNPSLETLVQVLLATVKPVDKLAFPKFRLPPIEQSPATDSSIPPATDPSMPPSKPSVRSQRRRVHAAGTSSIPTIRRQSKRLQERRHSELKRKLDAEGLSAK